MEFVPKVSQKFWKFLKIYRVFMLVLVIVFAHWS